MPSSDPSAKGSSPLTRGKLTGAGVWGGTERLIPAHAGKTPTDQVGGLLVWAHPRSRGENAIPSPSGSRRAGSSPLTRGKLVGVRRDAVEGRLIPAHAGKTHM